MRDGKQWIALLEEKERQKTGINSLKVGFNSIFGYYLEVTKANADLVPDRLYQEANPGQRRTVHQPGTEGI